MNGPAGTRIRPGRAGTSTSEFDGPNRREREAADRGNSTGVPAPVHHALRQPGQPLDSPTREFMENRFDQDFSHVRVHTGSEADASARAVPSRRHRDE